MNLFGKKKSQPIVKPDQAIHKLQETLDMLSKREAHLESQISMMREEAKKSLQQKNKSRAIHLLKKCKLLQTQVDSVFGTKFNLETQILALTQAVANTETVSAMRVGKDTLQGLEKQMDADNVANVMEEITESMANLSDVTSAMSQPIGPAIDEDELLAELDALSLESEPVRDVVRELDLPSVPKTVQEDEEELHEELRQLSLAMNA